jgi:DNA-binding winged helix-turn-helix (wHTH) protein/TolB-like protein
MKLTGRIREDRVQRAFTRRCGADRRALLCQNRGMDERDEPRGSGPEDGCCWSVDDLIVDLRHGSVTRGGRDLELPRLSFDLLVSLIRHAPAPVDTDTLMREVWGQVAVSDETVKQRVKLLRRTLGDEASGARYVATVRGRGYRLATTPVRREAEGSDRAVRRPAPLATVLAGAVVAIVIAVAGWTWWHAAGSAATGAPADAAQRVVVMTPQYLSPPAEGRMFAEGLASKLVAEVSAVPGMIVVPESLAVGGDPESLRAAGIHRVLRGTVTVRPLQLDVSLELLDLDRGEVRWAGSYHEQVGELEHAAAQQRISTAVGEALRGLGDREAGR